MTAQPEPIRWEASLKEAGRAARESKPILIDFKEQDLVQAIPDLMGGTRR